MKKSELFRVAQLCLPKLLLDADLSIHDESDLEISTVCTLWSGMGHIYRIKCPDQKQIIVKHVAAPRKNQSFGDKRKADSYQVEANFYENLAENLIENGVCLPKPLLVERNAGKGKNEIVIAMAHVESEAEMDLSTDEPLKAVLTWLAALHASHWLVSDETIHDLGLQMVGTYWHLDTRPEEHESMPTKGWEGRLKLAARAIDERLKIDPFQCIIHGDAKDANVLYNGESVYMCDFQYCGKGPPSKDLAYFFCSTLAPDDEAAALVYYLEQLTLRVPPNTTLPNLEQLQESVELAYCDFYRFMSGWGYWGSGGGEERVKNVLYKLDGGKKLASEDAYGEAVRRMYG